MLEKVLTYYKANVTRKEEDMSFLSLNQNWPNAFLDAEQPANTGTNIRRAAAVPHVRGPAS